MLTPPSNPPPRRPSPPSFIGFRPGDPTALQPPAAMPRPSVPPPPGQRVLDLRQLSQAQLLAEAAASLERDPFDGVLLPDPPGAGWGRRCCCAALGWDQAVLGLV